MHLAKHFAIPRQRSDYALILLARSTYSYPLMPFNAILDNQNYCCTNQISKESLQNSLGFQRNLPGLESVFLFFSALWFEYFGAEIRNLCRIGSLPMSCRHQTLVVDIPSSSLSTPSLTSRCRHPKHQLSEPRTHMPCLIWKNTSVRRIEPPNCTVATQSNPLFLYNSK